MSIFAWTLFGILTGLIVLVLDPKAQREGIIGPILLGIVGAIVGGIIANLVFGIGLAGVTMQTFSIAVSGSLILLFFGRVIKQV